MTETKALAHLVDIQAGALTIRPSSRSILGPGGAVTVEPLVMRLLIELARHAGSVVTRSEIFHACWRGAAVGDDSLNRVVAALRKALHQVAQCLVTIDTIQGAGYLLRLHSASEPGNAASAASTRHAVQEGFDSIRLGLPAPDLLRLEVLRQASEVDPANPEAWGMSALLYRIAAEYSETAVTADYVARCEDHARRALALDPRQVEAQVALATVAPLFGRWAEARSRLLIITGHSNHAFLPAHELSIVEMAIGRVTAAKALVDTLIRTDPLAACLSYKSTYQHWSVGDYAGMDQVAEKAIHLWPSHPAVWTCRFWTLAYTCRPQAALEMLADPAGRPDFPSPALDLFRAAAQARLSGAVADLEAAAQVARRVAQGGPVGAIAAIFALGLIERLEDQIALAFAYYLREGANPVPARRGQFELSVNEQHRRVTQILFTPACASFRRDPRFMVLCERMGLARYWRDAGLAPDFATVGLAAQ